MRFVLALVAFVVAAGMIALGIAQRTVLLPPPRAVVTTHVAKDVRYVVVPGTALHAHPGQQRLHVEGGGTVFAAYGRTSDVTAWLSGERYQRVGVAGPSETTASSVLTTAQRVPTLKTAAPHPDPDGADLWLDQQRATRSLDWTVNVPASVSLLIAADGATPAPSTVTVSWPVHASTPFATPLIVGGSLLVVVGLLLYMWGLVHMKRRRGPRRKSPPRMPRPPAEPRYRQAPEAAGTRARSAVRQFLTTGGVTAAGALLLAGCSAPGVRTAAPVAPAVAEQTAGMTTAQAIRVVRDVAAVARKADKARKPSLLAPRFAGPALVLRKAAYATRKHDKTFKLPQALPSSSASIRLTLPEATNGWPRTLFAVMTDTAETSAPPLALTLVQDDPRSPYRAQYLMSLAPHVELPNLAPSVTGAMRVQPDTDLLRVKPAELGADYGLLLRDPSAAPAPLFDTRHDDLMTAVGSAAKKSIRKHLGKTAKITFADSTKDLGPVVAMATADGGALVSVNLKEIWTVKPVKHGVTVKPSGATKALSRVTATGKGIVSTYGYQLLFSVPAAGSNRPVELLGYAQGLTSAKEL